MLYLFHTLIVLLTVVSLLPGFRKDGAWDRGAGRRTLRYFTSLSNLFCALSSLLLLVSLPGGTPPYPVWLLRYLATAAVTVTFLTVMVHLGPMLGYKSQLSGVCFYLHLLGPLLSLAAFCFFERFYPLPLGTALLGVLPVLLYGVLYLHQVVRAERWEDFYGFNKSGKWPVSFGAMLFGTFLICLLLWFLYRI